MVESRVQTEIQVFQGGSFGFAFQKGTGGGRIHAFTHQGCKPGGGGNITFAGWQNMGRYGQITQCFSHTGTHQKCEARILAHGIIFILVVATIIIFFLLWYFKQGIQCLAGRLFQPQIGFIINHDPQFRRVNVLIFQ